MLIFPCFSPLTFHLEITKMRIPLTLLLCVSVVFATDLRQTNPGSHSPDTSNPVFYQDTIRHMLVIKTASGCYFYHMTHEEKVDAQNPGGIKLLEDELIKELSSSPRLIPIVYIASLDHHTRNLCHNTLKFIVHRN